MHCRTHVVTETFEGERLGPGPASDRRLPLEDLHPETRTGQRQRGGQPVRYRAHHDGISTLHEATLPSAALPGEAPTGRVRPPSEGGAAATRGVPAARRGEAAPAGVSPPPEGGAAATRGVPAARPEMRRRPPHAPQMAHWRA